MQKQSTGILKSLSNTQKSFLDKSIESLPNTERTNNLISISNTQETRISKIIQESSQCGYIRSIGGGATN